MYIAVPLPLVVLVAIAIGFATAIPDMQCAEKVEQTFKTSNESLQQPAAGWPQVYPGCTIVRLLTANADCLFNARALSLF